MWSPMERLPLYAVLSRSLLELPHEAARLGFASRWGQSQTLETQSAHSKTPPHAMQSPPPPENMAMRLEHIKNVNGNASGIKHEARCGCPLRA
jgi:hypothetical protein